MNTVIQNNVNPIEKVEHSTLIMASVIYGGLSVEELSNENQIERLRDHAPMLFLES